MMEVRTVRSRTVVYRMIESLLLLGGAFAIFYARKEILLASPDAMQGPRLYRWTDAAIPLMACLLSIFGFTAFIESIFWLLAMIRFRGPFCIIQRGGEYRGARRRLLAWRDAEKTLTGEPWDLPLPAQK